MPNSRYKYSNIKLNSNGKRVYASMIYPKIKEQPTDIYITAKETDRLDLLAKKYYDDETQWWIIALANQISGTMYVEPGTQLRIPMDLDYIYSLLLESSNNV